MPASPRVSDFLLFIDGKPNFATVRLGLLHVPADLVDPLTRARRRISAKIAEIRL
jgi:hypothetical protein